MADRFQVMFGESPQAADDAFYPLVSSLEVEENADLPGAVQLTLPIATTTGASGTEDLTVVGDDRWKPYARLAVILNDHRGWAKATLPTYQDRKEFFEGIVNGHPDPVELVRQGRERDLLGLIEDAKERSAAALGASA